MKILAAIATLALASCSTGSAPPQYMQDAIFNLGMEYAENKLNNTK